MSGHLYRIDSDMRINLTHITQYMQIKVAPYNVPLTVVDLFEKPYYRDDRRTPDTHWKHRGQWGQLGFVAIPLTIFLHVHAMHPQVDPKTLWPIYGNPQMWASSFAYNRERTEHYRKIISQKQQRTWPWGLAMISVAVVLEGADLCEILVICTAQPT